MKKILLFILLLLFSRNAWADLEAYSTWTNTFDKVASDSFCSNGQILKKTAGAWACGSDDTGASAAAPGTVRVSEDNTFLVSADTVNFTTGLKAVVSGTTVMVSAEIATTTAAGIASFDTNVFTVRADGGVSTKALTGDVTTSAGGVATTIAADAVALGTDTTGNYVASVATTSPLTGGAGGSEGATLTLAIPAANATTNGYMPSNSMASIDSLVSVSHNAVTVAGHNYLTLSGQQITANDVALGTQTSGNYAAGDAEAGNALTGDSAASFFGAGELEVVRGGTALASISNDAVLVGNNGGTGYDQPALPNCIDSGGQHLNYTTATGVFTCGTSGDGTGGGGGGFMVRVSEDGTFLADNGNRQMNVNFTGGITGSVVTSGDTVSVSLDTVTVARGGTNLTDISNDAVLVGNNGGTGFDKPALPSCSNATTSKLLYNSGTNAFSCGTDQTGAGSSQKFVWTPQVFQAKLPLVNPAQIDAGKEGWRLLFDATTGERVSFDGVIVYPYAGGTVSIDVTYTMTSATSGKISLATFVECITSGDATIIDAGSYDSINNMTQPVPNTAGQMSRIGSPLGNFDSCAQGDRLRIMVSRDTVSVDDTATGDLELRNVLLYEV